MIQVLIVIVQYVKREGSLNMIKDNNHVQQMYLQS